MPTGEQGYVKGSSLNAEARELFEMCWTCRVWRWREVNLRCPGCGHEFCPSCLVVQPYLEKPLCVACFRAMALALGVSPRRPGEERPKARSEKRVLVSGRITA